jgi:predicted nuclease of predicted toxin-antitoxin system
LRGFPPKIIWLRIGNCATSEIVSLLRQHVATIIAFAADPDLGTLVL